MAAPRTYGRNPRPAKRIRSSPLPSAPLQSVHLPADNSPGPSSDPSSSSATAAGSSKRAAPHAGKQGTLKGFFTTLPAPARLAPRNTPAAAAGSDGRPAVRVATDGTPSLPPSSRASSSSSSSSSLQPCDLSSSQPCDNPSSTASTSATRRGPLQQALLAPLQQHTTCPTCSMTYSPHSPSDVGAHRVFCARVERGVRWFRTGESGEWDEVGEEVEWCADGRKGRARCVRVQGVPPGKVGRKIKEVHDLIDTTLSAPALPPSVLARTQTFLLLSSSPPPPPRSSSSSSSSSSFAAAGKPKPPPPGPDKEQGEHVIGACVVQRIEHALRMLTPAEVRARAAGSDDGEGKAVCLDAGAGGADGGVFCDPTPIPTVLGIHRIHLSARFRRLGLAPRLLDRACAHTVFGLRLGPNDDGDAGDGGGGGVAFSQPTGAGRRLMERWGGGRVRVFVEDEV